MLKSERNCLEWSGFPLQRTSFPTRSVLEETSGFLFKKRRVNKFDGGDDTWTLNKGIFPCTLFFVTFAESQKVTRRHYFYHHRLGRQERKSRKAYKNILSEFTQHVSNCQLSSPQTKVEIIRSILILLHVFDDCNWSASSFEKEKERQGCFDSSLPENNHQLNYTKNRNSVNWNFHDFIKCIWRISVCVG